ncbi:hypothetical protein CsSME_00030352 [Camellia sinensis var. sinensis]
MIRYNWFAEQFRGTEPETVEEIEHYARGFFMFLFGTTLFANRTNTIGLYLLSALMDLLQIRFYDQSSAGLATLYDYMSSTSCRSKDWIRGYWRAWEETFSFSHRYFDTVTAVEITWQPWATMPAGVRDQFAGSWGASPWFLGEQFLCRTMGLSDPIVPMAPPLSMRATKRLIFQEIIQFTEGLEANYFRGEGDHVIFIRTHLMLPLTGNRGSEGAGAPTARERARVPRVTRATRAHGRGATQVGQRTDWPELPTALRSPAATVALAPAMSPPAAGRRERQAPTRILGRARGT